MFFVWHFTLCQPEIAVTERDVTTKFQVPKTTCVRVYMCCDRAALMQHRSASPQMVALSDVIHLHFGPVLRRWVESTQTLSHSSRSRCAEAHHHANTHAGEDSLYPPESKCHFNKCPLESTYVQVLCCNTRRPP